MITEKLYDQDPYLKEFTARVLSCEPLEKGYAVVLNQTAFFPEGGGQFGDQGILGDVHVVDTQIDDNGTITHYTDGAIAPYEKVTGKIDWDLRFTRMQCHTGEHIVSGLVHSLFGYDNIGFRLSDDDVTCDYNGALTAENLKDIEHRANEVVFNNVEITAEYPDAEKLSTLDYRTKLDTTSNLRIVTIPGADVCACCAPHVHHTGEIGLIKIVNFEKAHGGTRLHLRIGRKALEDYEEKQEQMLKIIDLTSARQFETAEAVEKLYQQIAELQHELSQARTRQGEILLESLPKHHKGNLVVLLEHADTDALRALANGGKERCSGVFVALTEAAASKNNTSADSPSGYRYIITAKDLPLRSLARDFNEALAGRGGGHDDMIQGAFATDLDIIKKYFNENTF